MSTATVEQIGRNFAAWLAAVRGRETVVTVEKAQSKTVNPWANRMAELEAIFPEPVLGASEVLERMRADRL